MTWNRTVAAAAVTAALQVTLGEAVWVFDKPPQTANPPAVVVGRPEVQYAQFAFGIDEATIPVICAGSADGEDQVDALITQVRASFPDPTLGGVVQSCVPTAERNWRNITVGGIDMLQAEVELTIRM